MRGVHIIAVAAAIGMIRICLPAAQAIQDPAQEWRTLRTPTFDIHYYQGGEPLARRLAGIAETAHALMTRLLEWQPSQRPHIVVVDDIDTANGWTLTYPYNLLKLYAFAPEDDSELGRYDDYLVQLFVHEYTHLLHLDMAVGLPRVLNTVLGKTFQPNQLMPGWFTEGLATLFETELTRGGRIGSPLYDMMLRMAALEGTFLRLDEITQPPLTRPRGQVWYLYGSYFLKYVRDRFGLAALVRMAHEYAARIIPYGLNAIAIRVTGHSFIALYQEWQAAVRSWAAQTRHEIEARGLVEGRRLSDVAEAHDSPRYARDGRTLVYIESNGHQRQHVRQLDLATGRSSPLFECDGDCRRVTWGPSGRGLIVSATEVVDRYYFYRELFRWTPGRGPLERMTFGARAQEPTIDPLRRRLAFVRTVWGRSRLMLLDLDTGQQETLLAPDDDTQLAAPRFSPDGRQLAYSAWVASDGRRDIFVMDLASRTVRRLTDDDALDLQPAWSPDGAYLFVASSLGGIFNIHALRLADGQRWQVTNVLGGAFEPDVHPQGDRLVYLSYHANGYSLYELPLVPATWRPIAPPPPPEPTAPSIVAQPFAGPSETYHAWRSVWPHAWTPTYVFNQTGLADVGVQLSGQDALNRHRWLTSLSLNLQNHRVSAGGSYVYDGLPVVLSAALAHATPERFAFFQDRLWWFDEQVVGGTVGLSLPLPHTRRAFSLNADYNIRYSHAVGRPRIVHDPAELQPYVPRIGLLAGASFGWSYDDSESTLFGIAPERGRSIGFRLTVYHPSLGSRYKTVAARFSWQEYLKMPWPGHHVLRLGYHGGAAAGDPEFRAAFALGGLPEQDFLVALANNEPLGGNYLRGYPASRFGGLQFQLLNADYLFPLWNIFRGLQTLPFYAQRLTGALFVDTGTAYNGRFDIHALKVGIGAELRLQTTLFYSIPALFRLGYSRGLMAEGENQVFFVLGQGL